MNIYTEEELFLLTWQLRREPWYINLPEPVKGLVNKYPPGTYFDYAGERLYLISYVEGKNETAWGFGFSKINPGLYYEDAKNNFFKVCLDCFSKNILDRCIH